MKPTKGQIKDIESKLGYIPQSRVEILAEGGNDNGNTFSGNFLVKIKWKGIYRFSNGEIKKKVK